MNRVDMRRMLSTVRNSVATELYPCLDNPDAVTSATDIVKVLDRIIADLCLDGSITDEEVNRWRQLSAFKAVSPNDAATPAASVALADELLRAREALHAVAATADGPLGPDADRIAWLVAMAREGAAFIEKSQTFIDAPVMGALAGQPPARADAEQWVVQLNAFFNASHQELGTDPVIRAREIPGGKAKRTVLFELRENDRFPRRLALRVDYGGATQTQTITADEYPLIATLFESGVPVPEPILVSRDTRWFGGTFIIVREMEGATSGGDAFPELNDGSRFGADLGRQMARALARLHAVRRIPEDGRKTTSLSSADPAEVVRTFAGIWREHPRIPGWIGADLGLAWLLAHPLPADRPRCVVHGDVGAHNIMVRDGDLAAIVDWELAKLGDPAEDLGFCRLILIDRLMPWPDFVAAYIEAGGDPRACDPRAVNYFGIWAWTRSTIFASMLLDFYLAGDRDNIATLSTVLDQGWRSQQYLARELRIAFGLLGENISAAASQGQG